MERSRTRKESKSASKSHSALRDGGDNDHSTTDQSTFGAQDQILLDALQGFFMPLVRSVDPTNSDRPNAADRHFELGPESEATKLIGALRDFVLRVTGGGGSVMEEKQSIKVDLNTSEDDDDDEMDVDNVSESGESNATAFAQRTPNPRISSIFQDRVLRRLREHVFNKMPIRLLCITSLGTNLEISLIERGTIYTYIEKKILAEINAPGYLKPLTLVNRSALSEAEVKAIEHLITKHARYAILSHTWLRDAPEVTYADWVNDRFDEDGPGYDKLAQFCKVAWRDYGLTLAWMDTLCINKDSSSELDESIRSMYAWYERAASCIVYLAKSRTRADIRLDPWFTRGWTLQELLAPRALKFYNCAWDPFARGASNDKMDAMIVGFIGEATSISSDELRNIYNVPLSRRMELASSREVTREEDMAYSLMGIFSVSIMTAYGEGGERAFSRLLQAVLNSTSVGVLDLLNWAGEVPSADSLSSSLRTASNTTKILPTSPRSYAHRATNVTLGEVRPLEPLALTHMGLRIAVLLLSGIEAHGSSPEIQSIGDYWAKATFRYSEWEEPSIYYLLDKRALSVSSDIDTDKHQSLWPTYTFAVFNIRRGTHGILIPRTCTALLLKCNEDVGKVTTLGDIRKVSTAKPIVFDMERRGGYFGDVHGISVDGLARHGMQLVTLYL